MDDKIKGEEEKIGETEKHHIQLGVYIRASRGTVKLIKSDKIGVGRLRDKLAEF